MQCFVSAFKAFPNILSGRSCSSSSRVSRSCIESTSLLKGFKLINDKSSHCQVVCHSLRKRERSWANLRRKICGFLEKPQMHREKFFFMCQARFLDKFPSIAFLWISCKVPKSALKNFCWPLNSHEKQKQSKERGQRVPNGGKCRGRARKKWICASSTKLACYFSPYSTFFFLMLAYLVIILVVSSNGTQDLLGRQSWLYQGKLERNVMPSKVRWCTRNPGTLWRRWPGVTLWP